MKLDDETLLTAYLDDELDERERRLVAAALQSNPRLADQLHELVQVRALLAGLDRPETSYDLVGGVMVRIGAQSAGRWWNQVRLPAVKLPTIKLPAIKVPKSSLAAAASLFILATLVLVFGHRHPQDRILNRSDLATADSRSNERTTGSHAATDSSSVASLAMKPHEEAVKEIDEETSKPATLLAKTSLPEVA